MDKIIYKFKFSEAGKADNVLSLTMGEAIVIARNRVINRGCDVKLYAECHGRFIYLGEYCPALDGIYQVRAFPKTPKIKVYGCL